MHNVHEDLPVLFYTRWALSYLRGPLTRKQIALLMENRKRQFEKVQAPYPLQRTKPGAAHPRPVLPPEIPQYFIPLKGEPGPSETILYKPSLYAATRLHFIDSRKGIDTWTKDSLLAEVPESASQMTWDDAIWLGDKEQNLDKNGLSGAGYASLPSPAKQSTNYKNWKKNLSNFLYQNKTLKLWKSPALKEISKVGESEGDFRVRLSQTAHEIRDLEIEKLRNRYSSKVASMEERLRKAQVRLEKEKTQYSHQKVQTVISFGATVLGAFFGRKLGSTGNIGRATTGMRGIGRAAQQKQDVEFAQQEIRVAQQNLAELEREFQSELAHVKENFNPENIEFQEILIKPRKSDISVSDISLVWIPWRVGSSGFAEPAY